MVSFGHQHSLPGVPSTPASCSSTTTGPTTAAAAAASVPAVAKEDAVANDEGSARPAEGTISAAEANAKANSAADGAR